MNQIFKQAATTTFLALLLSISTFAQSHDEPCAFDNVSNNRSILKAEAIIQNGVVQLKNTPISEASHDSLFVIPVVIHVIHEDGPENISDAQIQSQIQIMNEDYGKLSGTNGDGAGVDTRVRFKLAQIDPDGNCTNGIVRIFSSLTAHKTYERAMLKELSFWDNTKYMNIYLVKSISGSVLGYSSFPGGPADEDGMVVRSNVFGNMGTANGQFGRTASHEIGHWFGLYHTFNNGCGTDLCTDGDYVCDTPPQASPSFDCSDINSCSNDVPDVNDQKENYMNYTPGSCKSMFTEGQRLRIKSTLQNIRTIIWSEANLIATGTDSNYTAPTVCGVAANFVTLTPTVCEGNSVQFIDISLNNATSWNWTFPGGNPSSSTDQNPVIEYATLGNFDVTLEASDGTTSSTKTTTNFIDVTTPGVGQPGAFYESFDKPGFINEGVSIVNYDGGITWELDSAASVSGGYSFRINNLINTNYGSSDEIVLPYFDLSSHTGTTLFLTFQWAYARSDPSFSDEMIVLLSTDCGVNYNQVYYRSGNGLVTGPTQTTPFVPDSSQWKKAEVFLGQYINFEYVQIKIVNVTDGGNNLYIDDLNLGDFPTGITPLDNGSLFSIYPNPASSTLNLKFDSVAKNRTLSIYNTIGKQVLSKELGAENQTSISTESLQNGVYVLEITENNTRTVQKLIISK